VPGHRESFGLLGALIAPHERELQQSLERVEHEQGVIAIGHRAYGIDRVEPSWAAEHAEPAEEQPLARRQ
jgi:hypothetical protein